MDELRNASLVVLLSTVVLVIPTVQVEATVDDDGPGTIIIGGAFALNGILALVNGYNLAHGTPSQNTGILGVSFGSVTTAISLVGIAGSDGDPYVLRISLIVGACGLAAAITGGMNLWAEKSTDIETGQTGTVSVLPAYRIGFDDRPELGLQVLVRY